MLKITGLFGLVLASGMIGINKTLKLKRRLYLLEDFYQMIIILKSNINYFKEPLPDLFKKVSQNSHSKAFSFLEGLAIEIMLNQCEIADLWALKANSNYRNEPLLQSDLDIICFPGEFIGQTDFKNQLSHFEYIEDKLKLQIEAAKTDLHNKSPMYNKIGFFIGGIIACLLI